MRVRPEELSVHLGSYSDEERRDLLLEAPRTRAHVGGSANTQAATRVKPEQASKGQVVGAEPPFDRRRLQGSSERNRPTRTILPPGYWAQHAWIRCHRTRETCLSAVLSDGNRAVLGGLWQESEEPIVPMKPGNSGGGKGLWFGVRLNEKRTRGLV